MSKTNASNDREWNTLVGLVAGIGAKGTATASSAASLTDSGATWGTTQFVGGVVVAGSGYANIISHTGTVLTLDRWYDAATPGGAALATPSGTATYCILPGGAPNMFTGLSASVAAVGSGDTTLVGEITTVGGGLIRKISSLAHTTGASTGTLTTVYTANGTDSLPVTIGKIGVGPSLLSTLTNLWQTLLGTTATLSLSGDQLTTTDTITL